MNVATEEVEQVALEPSDLEGGEETLPPGDTFSAEDYISLLHVERKVSRSALTCMLQRVTQCEVYIGRWRGMIHLTPEFLGIPKKEAQELFRLGQQFLAPRKIIGKLDSLDTSIRRVIKKSGFSIGGKVLVPIGCLPQMYLDLRKYEDQYYQIRDEMVRDHDKNITTIMETYHTYLEKKGLPLSLMEKIRSKIPGKQALHNSFGIRVSENLVMMPDMEADIFRTYIEALQTEEEKVVMQRLMEKKMQQAQERLSAFYLTLVHQIKAQIYDVLKESLEDFTAQGDLEKGKVRHILNVLASIQRLNFTGDPDVTAWTEEIRNMFLFPKASRDKDSQREVLERITSEAKNSAEIIKSLGSRAAWLEL